MTALIRGSDKFSYLVFHTAVGPTFRIQRFVETFPLGFLFQPLSSTTRLHDVRLLIDHTFKIAHLLPFRYLSTLQSRSHCGCGKHSSVSQRQSLGAAAATTTAVPHGCWLSLEWFRARGESIQVEVDICSVSMESQ